MSQHFDVMQAEYGFLTFARCSCVSQALAGLCGLLILLLAMIVACGRNAVEVGVSLQLSSDTLIIILSSVLKPSICQGCHKQAKTLAFSWSWDPHT